MATFSNSGSGGIVVEMAAVIVANKAFLSEIDGLIGDGDHGVNMAKGFGRAAGRISDAPMSFTAALEVLSDVLLTEIGGSMGPLYGMMFAGMAKAIDGVERIDAVRFAEMLRAGAQSVSETGGAQVGDKTMVDVLVPAVASFDEVIKAGSEFSSAVDEMRRAAEIGRDSTIDMVAKIGRSARLGPRSRGVQDAGATSCCMLLVALAEGVKGRL